MKCVIPGSNMKVFGRAVHSLSKIGEEVYIEPLEHGLALRTVNSSRSAYACFLFAPSFFQHYDDGSGEINSQDSEDCIRCKIGMKSILTVFRSLSTMEKTVERCRIQLNMDDARLVFQLHCRHGIIKTHNLAFIECETLQAVFSKDMCVNSLTASSKLLCDAVMNFQNNQEEVTLIVNPEKTVLKNYVEDEPDPNKVMHTNLNLDPDEFDNYQVGVDTEVTFCLKELRAILAFAEVTTLPVQLHFETAGRPIVFTIDSDSTFEANFVLATLADQQGQSQVPSQAHRPTQKRSVNKSNLRPTQGRSSVPAHYRPAATNHGDASSTSRHDRSDLNHTERLAAPHEEPMQDNDDLDDMVIENQTTMYVGKSPTHGRTTNINTVTNKDTGGTIHPGGDNSRGDNQRIDLKKSRSGRLSPQPGHSKDDSESPVIPVVQSTSKFGDRLGQLQNLSSDDDSDAIPGTPPAKRFRSLFFGSSQATQPKLSQSPDDKRNKSLVLAEDTDDES